MLCVKKKVFQVFLRMKMFIGFFRRKSTTCFFCIYHHVFSCFAIGLNEIL